ncbi:uncharacterized protein LOC112875079 isoform X1 [Panicum hallii]|uniref:uncharacterized protein LOC112875079 isoform X1 n=1 Tax=Panicum hallii TaxID=206008 RepID=UPI000DF4E809|nr:uncharacterized protein LOC112875079 isoform X1 [Panicum hallii]
MTSLEERDSACWDQVFESIDLLYAKVGEMDTTQQRMSTQMDLGNQVMEQILKDQQTLAQQMEATRQAIARFSQNVPSQPDPHHHQRPVVDPPPHRRTPPPVSGNPPDDSALPVPWPYPLPDGWSVEWDPPPANADPSE